MDAKPAWKSFVTVLLIAGAAGTARAADDATEPTRADKPMEEVVVAAPLPSRSAVEEIAADMKRQPAVEALTLNLGAPEIARPTLGRPLHAETAD